eukprot:gnl/Trimastix_PCT/712.p1 GENE.gnl/Trimastix_PCT/712~~gnl/Trimastix_PCT/712.p1  ORF type:complete len:366 (+),score=44.66 gnl/Trimastix_PCT/712:82-1098(+)
MTRPVLIFLLIPALVLAWWTDNKYDRSVKLSTVQTLTFDQRMMTTARRSSPIPQIQCVGGSAMSCPAQDKPAVIQCRNMGAGMNGPEDIQWKCEAEVPSNYKLGQTTVSCEGYDSPEDDYVLKGSCGVEYTYDYANTHEQQRAHEPSAGYHAHAPQRRPLRDYRVDSTIPPEAPSSDLGFPIKFLAILAAIAIFVACCCCTRTPRSRRPTHTQSTHHTHTHAYAPPAGSPPPYTGPAPSAPPPPSQPPRASYAPYSAPGPCGCVPTHSAPLGGLGTVLGAAALGAVAGRSRRVEHHHHHHHAAPASASAPRASPAAHSSPRSSPPSHTSTGYGGTKRR